MLAGLILSAHALAVLYAFVRYKKESLSEGFLAVGFFVVLFAAGWTLSTMLISPLMNTDLVIRWIQEPSLSAFSRIARKELNRDTMSLLLVTFLEVMFYRFFLKPEKKNPGRSTSI